MSEATPAEAPTWFQWSFFPAALGLGLGITLLQTNSGVAAANAIGAGQLSAIAFIALCERLFPYYPSWNRSRGDFGVDMLHGAVTFAMTAVGTALGTVIAVRAAGWLSQRVGGSLWPDDAPLAAQVVLALVVGEFFQYWWHRWQHETDLLWRLHAVHHSPERLYWLNASRFHPLDILPNQLLALVPLVALGCGETTMAFTNLLIAIHGLCQHANVRLRCGPLNWIFSMAELHRWHHSTVLEEANHNYGQTLILWDIVFGTRFLPADRGIDERIGLGDPRLARFPTSYLGQLASPFRWRQIVGADSQVD